MRDTSHSPFGFLQWSPDLAAGKTRRLRRARLGPRRPSMEPRPRGRGNTTPPSRRSTPSETFNGAPTSRPGKPSAVHALAMALYVLQWSPDLAAGETPTL